MWRIVDDGYVFCSSSGGHYIDFSYGVSLRELVLSWDMLIYRTLIWMASLIMIVIQIPTEKYSYIVSFRSSYSTNPSKSSIMVKLITGGFALRTPAAAATLVWSARMASSTTAAAATLCTFPTAGVQSFILFLYNFKSFLSQNDLLFYKSFIILR